MDPDPYKEYQKQLDYKEYVQLRYDNPIDLTSEAEENDSVRMFANILFNKSERNLGSDLHGLLMDSDTEVADIFCMVVELFLYGFDIITKGTEIFQLIDSTDDLVYKMKNYFKSAGISLTVDEVFDDTNVNLYRDRDDYYCQITSKPPLFLQFNSDWNVLGYRLLTNRKFQFDTTTPLNKFKTFFINKYRRIFILSFSLIN